MEVQEFGKENSWKIIPAALAKQYKKLIRRMAQSRFPGEEADRMEQSYNA